MKRISIDEEISFIGGEKDVETDQRICKIILHGGWVAAKFGGKQAMWPL